MNDIQDIAKQLKENPALLDLMQALLSENQPDDDDLITISETAKMRGCSVPTHYRDIDEGRFPPPMKTGPNRRHYRRGTVRKLIAEQEIAKGAA